MSGVRVNVLGPLQLFVDDVAVQTERQQVRLLAARLALAGGRPVHAGDLVGLLWTEADLPRDPSAALRVVASRLRSLLSPYGNQLQARHGSYLLEASTDLEEFERRVHRSASEADPGDVTASLERAVGLWRGLLLSDLPDGAWVDDARWRAEHLRRSALAQLGEALIRADRASEAVALLAPFVADNLDDEQLSVLLAAALGAEGRRAEGLEVLAATRQVLRAASGLQPGRVFAEVEQQLLHSAIDIGDITTLIRPGMRTFVGRQRQLEALLEPDVGVMVLSGEPGVGKSALLTRMRDQLQGTGTRVVSVAAPAVPARAMETLGALLSTITVGSGARLPPILEALTGDAREPAEDERVPFTRESLIGATVDYICAWAGEQDTVVVVDDAHWLDLGTAEVLERVASAGDCRMVLGTRPGENLVTAPLFGTTERDRVVQLESLELAEVRQYVERTLGSASSARAEDLHARSGGNPLFLELLVELAREGVPTEERLPSSALIAVQQRLQGLSVRCRQTLRLAAVLGEVFSTSVVEAVAPGAVADLREAAEAGLLVIDEEAHQGRFAHQIVHEGVYQLIPPGERTSWHDRFGRQMEASGAPATAYVVHAMAAIDLDPVRAATACVDACRMHTDRYAWDQALTLAQTATQRASAVMPRALRAELLLIIGTSLRRMGRESTDALLAAAAAADAHGDLGLRAAAARELCGHGGTTLAGTVHEEGHRYLSGLLDEPLTPVDRARLLASAGPLYATSDRSAHGRDMFLEATELAAEIGDPRLELEVLMNTDLGLSSPEDLERRRANAHRLVQLAPADPDVAWEAAYLLHGIACVLCDAEEAERSIADIRRLAGMVRARPRELGRTLAEVAHHVGFGQLDEAEVWAQRVPEAGGAFSDSWVTLTYGACLMSVREAQGRLPEVMELVEAAIGSSPSTYHSFHAIAAGVAAAAGDQETARREVDRLKPDGFSRIALADLPSTMLLSMLADATVLVGDTEAAASLVERLTPFEGRMAWSGVSTHGPITARLERLRAMLET